MEKVRQVPPTKVASHVRPAVSARRSNASCRFDKLPLGRVNKRSMPATAKKSQSSSPAKQLEKFIGKFDSKVARQIRSIRAALRKRFPTAYELVYDNYNFFVIGFCSSPRASDCIVSMASNAHGVTLFFYYGARLPDPSEILQGSGNQVRFIRLESVATLAEPAVEKLIRAAIAEAKTPLPAKGPNELIIKSISSKQRPRR
jgi:hypothetical protein